MELLKRSLGTAISIRAYYLPYIPKNTLRIIILTLLFSFTFYYLFAAPASFVPGSVVRIPYGTTTSQVVERLSDAEIVSHPTLLQALLRLSGQSGSVQTGVYKFEQPQNVFLVAYRLAAGDFGLPPVRVTFIEGLTVREMAEQVSDVLPDISEEEFLQAARGQEGYLFPDTYFLQPSATAEEIVAAVRANFDEKVATLSSEIAASGRSFSDIVTMASLVEKEARSSGARQMVAGILWNRIDRDMPLQVDAVFGYIFGRETYSPSYADLKVDSPYNTYTHRGLPPGPIANPGLDAFLAVLHPTKTKYLFYLTGNDGQMYYATTYAGHQANQQKYLP